MSDIRTPKPRCRHSNHSWLICGGLIEWCYRCGAFRRLKIVTGNTVEVDGAWALPTGENGANPWEEYTKRDSRYRLRTWAHKRG